MIDINKVKVDDINYGALKVYEYGVELVDEGEFMLDSQVANIFKKQFDLLKINLYLETEWKEALSFHKVLVSEEELVYATGFNGEDKVLKLTISKDASGNFSYSIEETSGGGSGSLDYATNADIDALFGIEPAPTMWNITYNLTGCWQGSGAESQVADGSLLQFQLHSNFSEYEWQSVVITMGGEDITATAWNEGNEDILISHVTGEVVITAICVETQPAETYTVAYSSMDSNITFSDDQAEVEANDPLELYVVPNAGYRLKESPSMIIMMGGINIAMTAFNTTTGRIYIEHVTGEVRINAISVAEPDTPQPTTWTVAYQGNCMATNTSTGEEAPDSIEDAGTLDVTLEPDDPAQTVDMMASSITVTMGGVDIGGTADCTINESGDTYQVIILNVTGDVSISVNFAYDYEEVPIESIRYTDGQGNTCVGFGMLEGESVDLWNNLEVLPVDYTDGVEFVSSNDSAIQVDGGGVATAVGTSGESAIITIRSMEDANVYTTVEISINIDEPDDPEEEEE